MTPVVTPVVTLLRRAFLLGLVLSLCLSVVAGATAVLPSAAAAETYTFHGRGWGHGRGMSQWGAARSASLGKSAEQILAFYYAGTRSVRFRDRTVRVLLTATDGDRLVRFRRQAGLVARVYAADGRTVKGSRRLTDHEHWQVRTDAAGLRLEWSDGRGWKQAQVVGRSVFAGGTQVGVSAPAAMRLYDEDGAAVRHRGSYRVIRRDSTRLRVVNHVRLESQYLPSVVPSESRASWPAPALQAQAIAARSFTAWYLQHPRARDHDICDTVACQVYRGLSAENPRTTSAVRATRERVRAAGGTVVRAEFSSSNGGSVAAGGRGHSPARYDPWSDGPWDPNHAWTKRITASTIAAKVFGRGATLTGFRVTKRNGHGDWRGRVLSMTFEARRGGKTLRATRTGEQVRFLLGLRSSYFVVSR